MSRRKTQLPYKVDKRTFSNGKKSENYYAQIRNEYGKKVWLNLGTNRKKAESDLLKEVAEIARRKEALASKKQVDSNKQTFLDYLKENHYFEPELNIQYVVNKTTKKKYGLQHSKQVASFFHRLFDEDKGNDEIGRIPFNNITHQDVVGLLTRLQESPYFKTNIVRNRLLDMLSSSFKFLANEKGLLLGNPFRSVSPLDESKETSERPGMMISQIRKLFADEETINKKIVDYLIAQNDVETQEKTKKVMSSDRSDSQKKRLINDLNTWKEKKNANYKEYRFTDTEYYRYFRFMLGTGVRGAECRALQYSAFSQFPYVRIDKGFKEQNSKRTSIDEPKWGKKRIVYMCESLQKMMSYANGTFNEYTNEYEFSKPSDYFVFSEDGGKSPLCSNELRRKWTMFSCAMGFKKSLFTPHSLRHSIAALMMDKGVPEWLVVKWCGWEISSKMVINYAKREWNYEYPEFRQIIAPLIEEYYFAPLK